MDDINIGLSEILNQLQKLSNNSTEEVLLIIITAIILVIILIQRIYHCYALVCKNNNSNDTQHNTNIIADETIVTNDNIFNTELISRRC